MIKANEQAVDKKMRFTNYIMINLEVKTYKRIDIKTYCSPKYYDINYRYCRNQSYSSM